MEFAPLVVASALVWKLVSFLKYLTSGAYREALTLAIVWVAGIAVAALLAASDFSAGIEVGEVALASLNAAGIVLFGVALGSTAAVGFDFKKSFDNNDAAVEPKLGA